MWQHTCCASGEAFWPASGIYESHNQYHFMLAMHINDKKVLVGRRFAGFLLIHASGCVPLLSFLYLETAQPLQPVATSSCNVTAILCVEQHPSSLSTYSLTATLSPSRAARPSVILYIR